jgi:thymidylate synthase ThyX
MTEYNEEDKKILKNHVTNLDQDIYCIFNLPPEVVAVLFAYVSRSPASFRDNLLKLLKGKELDMKELIKGFESVGLDFSHAKEKAADFHKKWVVGYGHSSVAEHAYASVALENVSIIASKVIEDCRLASYTEKSTRYQKFDRTRVCLPSRLKGTDHEKTFKEAVGKLFDCYEKLFPKMIGFVKGKYPRQNEESERFYETISNARAFDLIRYLLPAGTMTNIAMTANAREYEYAIVKFLSSELPEIQEIGKSIKKEVKKLIPTLVMFADKNKFLSERPAECQKMTDGMLDFETIEDRKDVELVKYDEDAYDRIVTSILYSYSNYPFKQIEEKVKNMSLEQKEKVIETHIDDMGPHDRPMRELENTTYTFDILLDYGAFRDVQRHRMCTQINQDLTIVHGYDVPVEISEAGFEEEYKSAIEAAEKAYLEISKEFPKEAQYIVPLAFRKRILITWNLRELHHFIRLRTGKEGHISYRIIAKECYDEIMRVHPALAKWIQVHDIEGPSR